MCVSKLEDLSKKEIAVQAEGRAGRSEEEGEGELGGESLVSLKGIGLGPWRDPALKERSVCHPASDPCCDFKQFWFYICYGCMIYTCDKRHNSLPRSLQGKLGVAMD